MIAKLQKDEKRTKSTQTNRWLVDVMLLIGFLVCFFMNLTGLALHQWLGIAAGAITGYHLITHQKWVSAVTQRFFGKTSNQARIFYLVDTLLLAGFLTMIASGLVISTWLNLSVANYDAWRAIHILASIGSLLIVIVKIWLHEGWIRAKIPARIVPIAVQSSSALPVSAGKQGHASRRSFLKMMSVVGAVSLFASANSFVSLASVGSDASSQETTIITSETTSSDPELSSLYNTGVNSTGTNTGTCVIRCGKRCSFPGHCGRYTDTNANGRCDLGECLS